MWMRSETLKPASLRATWTRRMKSRATPFPLERGDRQSCRGRRRRPSRRSSPRRALRRRWKRSSYSPASIALAGDLDGAAVGAASRAPAFAAASTSFIAGPRRLPTMRGLTDSTSAPNGGGSAAKTTSLTFASSAMTSRSGPSSAWRGCATVSRAERQAVAKVLRRADRGRRRADRAREVHALDQRLVDARTPRHPASPAGARSRRSPARGGCAR